MKKPKQATRIIGRVDKIDLPGFEIEDLDCKVDTGADTSSIHCSKVKIVEQDGVEFLKFRVLDKKHPQFSKKTHLVHEFSEKRVKSSSGHSELRYVIKTKVIVFGTEFPITFTLSDREKMKYPVLLGRRFLKNKFIVDVSKTDLSHSEKTKKP
ncbi:MAG: ATP-dependent zinc protease [Flavobacteriales bacterium]|nr:ATP-dependent zinc protease [Flavobacteriales bacterium]